MSLKIWDDTRINIPIKKNAWIRIRIRLDLTKDRISGGVHFYLVAGYGEGWILDTGEEMVEVAPGPRLLAVSALRVISDTWVNINF